MTELPTIDDPALFIVLMTCVLALGLSRFIAHWAEARFSKLGFVLTVIAGLGFGLVWQQQGLEIATIPEAFLEIIARLIR